MRTSIRTGLAAILLAASGAGALAAGGTTYRTTLGGGQEVPAVDTEGSGTLEASFDPQTKRLTWTGTYQGLTGAPTAAHFHGPAAMGENAGVLVPATVATSPFTGEAELDEAKAAALTAGKLYFNIHTAAHPKGEIRGQVEHAR